MDSPDPIAVARRYVELSNEARLDEALAMFADDATYGSSQVGSFDGRAAIGDMMRGFFARYPRPHWDVPEYRLVAGDAVEFDFVMTATLAGSGESIERRGTERIALGRQGLISRIEVRVRD